MDKPLNWPKTERGIAPRLPSFASIGAGMFTGLDGLDFAALGIPSEEEYIAAYCARTGRDNVPHIDYLMTFVMFRLAAITHGIRGRLARGNASSNHAEATAALTEPLADLAWKQAQSAKF